MIALIEQHRDQIVALCRRYGVRRLDLFGSAASGEFNPEASDIDFFYELYVTEANDYADRFFDLHDALESLLGHKVDLVSAKDAKNPSFLEVANRYRQTLYAA